MNYVIDFIKSIFPNTTIAFFLIALAILTFWMYKELRTSYFETIKNNQQRIEKAIDLYSDLELELYKFLNEKSDFYNVTEKISKASSIMTYEILLKCNQCKLEVNIEKRTENLNNLYDLIKKEIVSLKLIQIDSVTFKSDDTVFDFAENYVKTKIAPFIIPLFQTVLNMLFLLIIIFFTSIVLNESSSTFRILYISVIFAVMIYIMLINIIVSAIIMKKRFKNSIFNWFLFSLFAIVPPVLFFVGPWYRGILTIILMFLYAFYVIKKCKK